MPLPLMKLRKSFYSIILNLHFTDLKCGGNILEIFTILLTWPLKNICENKYKQSFLESNLAI